jgi:hypothetical protein
MLFDLFRCFSTLFYIEQAAMDRFSPQQRDCYSEGEIELKYLPRDHGYRYEMSNCLFEATFEHILSVNKSTYILPFKNSSSVNTKKQI